MPSSAGESLSKEDKVVEMKMRLDQVKEKKNKFKQLYEVSLLNDRNNGGMRFSISY